MKKWSFLKRIDILLYSIDNFQHDRIQYLIDSEEIFPFSENIEVYDHISFISQKPTVICVENKIMFKFSHEKKTIIGDEEEKIIKYVVLAVLHTDANLLEIRFDPIKGIFKSSEDFYKKIVSSIKAWCGHKLFLNFQNIEYKPVVKKLVDIYNSNEETAEVIPYKRAMNLKTGSKVMFDIDANKSMVVPILGVLRNLIRNNKEEFDKSPIIYAMLKKFIDEIEDSDVPKASLFWRTKGILLGITHGYKDTEYSLFQYYGELKDSEVMDFVTRYLDGYRTIGQENEIDK